MMNVDTTFRVIRRGRALLGAGLLAGLLVVAGCDSQDLGDANPQTPSIVEISTEVPALSRLEEGLRKSGLVDDLEGEGPFTVIAPDDDAFSPIGNGELSQSSLLKTVLEAHVIPGERIVFGDLGGPQTVQTLSGEDITFDSGGSIDGTGLSVTNSDVNASNGVLHVVDGVFADAVDRIMITAQYRILGELIGREGLAGNLRADSLTVFAPSNRAFLVAFDDNDNGGVVDDELQGTDVTGLLQGHVHEGVFSAEAFLDVDDPGVFPKDTTLTALNGEDITVTTNQDGSAVFVNPDKEDASVVTPDVKTRNGRIHGIDTVLMP